MSKLARGAQQERRIEDRLAEIKWRCARILEALEAKGDDKPKLRVIQGEGEG